MIWAIIIILIILFAIFHSWNPPEKTKKQTVELDMPNPENGHPKKIINFIDDHDASVIKQAHEQLLKLNKRIPSEFEVIFQDKIRNGYIQKENYLWAFSLEDYDIVHDHIKDLKKTYTFEIKGLQNYTYRKAIKNCILYEEVFFENEPNNKFDKNAIRIFCLEGNLGYVPATETSAINKIVSGEYKAYLENVSEINSFIQAHVVIHYN